MGAEGVATVEVMAGTVVREGGAAGSGGGEAVGMV
jgi:hypothetical protein